MMKITRVMLREEVIPKLCKCLREAVIEMCHDCTFCTKHPDYKCKAVGWYAECYPSKFRAVLEEASGESEPLPLPTRTHSQAR